MEQLQRSLYEGKMSVGQQRTGRNYQSSNDGNAAYCLQAEYQKQEALDMEHLGSGSMYGNATGGKYRSGQAC